MSLFFFFNFFFFSFQFIVALYTFWYAVCGYISIMNFIVYKEFYDTLSVSSILRLFVYFVCLSFWFICSHFYLYIGTGKAHENISKQLTTLCHDLLHSNLIWRVNTCVLHFLRFTIDITFTRNMNAMHVCLYCIVFVSTTHSYKIVYTLYTACVYKLERRNSFHHVIALYFRKF